MIVRHVPEASLTPFTPLEKLRLIGEISTTYARVRWLMRSRSVPEVADLVRARASGTAGEADRDLKWFALRLGNAVERNLDHLPGDNRCLARSLVLLQMLARRGIRSTLVIGVRPAPEFGAHAWVELEGQALLSPSEYGAGRLTEL
jgi:hypothetical protein